MRGIYLKVEPLEGSMIRESICEALELSIKLDILVEIIINGIECRINPADTYEQIYYNYVEDLGEEK